MVVVVEVDAPLETGEGVLDILDIYQQFESSIMYRSNILMMVGQLELPGRK